jgi:hypothetical protein
MEKWTHALRCRSAREVLCTRSSCASSPPGRSTTLLFLCVAERPGQCPQSCTRIVFQQAASIDWETVQCPFPDTSVDNINAKPVYHQPLLHFMLPRYPVQVYDQSSRVQPFCQKHLMIKVAPKNRLMACIILNKRACSTDDTELANCRPKGNCGSLLPTRGPSAMPCNVHGFKTERTFGLAQAAVRLRCPETTPHGSPTGKR